ncbi:hypothetical protein HOL24_09435 [bacterium]|nr:hypothetical protein [bacterium]
MIFIPAKYGSTRVYCKNFRSFYNKLSLLQIAIIRCVEAKCGPVVVSSENISEVRLQLGLLPKKYSSGIILHDRGEKLAKDPATILNVLVDFTKKYTGKLPSAIATVLPTSPFNSSNDIVKAFELFKVSSSDKLLSVSKSDKPPFNAWLFDDNPDGVIKLTFPENIYKLTQSTSCPETYFSNGCISIYDTKALVGGYSFNSTQGFFMDRISSLDIDYDYEFELAQMVFLKWSKDSDILNNISL